jgi:hypothetical protein
MFARFTALFCLLFWISSIARAESFQTAPASVTLYLKAEAADAEAALDSMRKELARLMKHGNFELLWMDPNQARANAHGPLVVVELQGACNPSQGVTSLTRMSPEMIQDQPLASSQVVSGRILPFVWLHCETLNHFLGSSLAGASAAYRETLYGRAMARLIAHELYHFLVQTRHHTRSGVTQSQVTPGQVLAFSLDFDRRASLNLHASQLPSPGTRNRGGMVPNLPREVR